jgi:hypothetical protein
MRAARRVLERLEESLRTAVESVGRLLPGQLQPLELAAELTRAMDRNEKRGPEGVFAANDYRLRLAREDRELLGGLVGELEGELAYALVEHAAERGYLTGPRVTVRLEADESVGVGRVRAEARFSEAPAPARLTVISGLPPRSFDFAGEVDLGRSPDCRLFLDEQAVSRRHARLVWTYPGYVLEDLGSNNGTFVNGERIERQLLRGGEILEMGLVQLRFTYVQD